MVFASCQMHRKSFPPSFRSVKVNGSHYACSPPAQASTHTHTHTHRKKYSHTIFRGFYFSVSREQRKRSWRRHLLFPWAPAQPEGRWKVGLSLWIPTFPPLSSCSLSPLSLFSTLLNPSSCPLVAVYPKEGHSHPSPDDFLALFLHAALN